MLTSARTFEFADERTSGSALIESAIGLYKTELIQPAPWHVLADAELATGEYVGWYNTPRPHTAIGGLPPAEY
jgi:putative transposase